MNFNIIKSIPKTNALNDYSASPDFLFSIVDIIEKYKDYNFINLADDRGRNVHGKQRKYDIYTCIWMQVMVGNRVDLDIIVKLL